MLSLALQAAAETPHADVAIPLAQDTLLALLINLIIASILGSLIAFHPLRLGRNGGVDWEMKKCQILICVLGVILVQIVAGELALAFALVGVGSFIRFRTPVQNPLEGAIIFVQIMIGMACGGHNYTLALVFTASIFVLLLVLNVREELYTELWEVKTQGGAADRCRVQFETLAGQSRFRIERLNLKLQTHVFTCRFRPPGTVDVASFDRRYRGMLEQHPDAIQWNRLE
ncbi:DUF4956 domain-containing protein [Candidatus Sumerlaeota bacterium]|nr:DUF4956 domain-containing protein [Candidatus Sumerlaeota bacterium]